MHHHLPLAGRRILLPQRGDRRLAEALRHAGAEVDEVALITRTPVPSQALHELAGDLAAGRYQWLAISSAFTVEALARLSYPLYRLVTPTLGVAAVGRSTAAAVRAACGRVDLQPAEGIGGHALATAWPAGPGRVALPGALASAEALPTLLRERGWDVERVGVYRTAPVSALPADVVARWRAGGYSAVVITAGSVAQAAATLLGTNVPAVAIGSPSATAASRAGYHRVVISPTLAPGDLVAALASVVG
ncbi:MAG TPA: uroporphyrinogen-III synthase [Propionicimonas sp.]|nr:uroporphyrinogen-III synthase [Propionicimonas sp.]